VPRAKLRSRKSDLVADAFPTQSTASLSGVVAHPPPRKAVLLGVTPRGFCVQEMQAAFYREVADMSVQDAAVKLTTLTHQESHEEFSTDSGKWRPLSVWKAKGYDV